MTYRHALDYNQSSHTTNVSAIAATIAELRRAKQFKVRFDAKHTEDKTIPIADLVILYDDLK